MSNPLLNKAFDDAYPIPAAGRMTLAGTIDRAMLLFAVLVIAAAWTWNLYFTGNSIASYLAVGLIGGLAVALVIIFVRHLAPYLAPVYAAFEGLALGGLSATFQGLYYGIVMQAVLVTVCIMGVMFLLYRSRIIRATKRFWIGVTAATGGVMLFYLVDIVLSFFNIQIPFFNSGGIIGIAISLVIICVASLNLILDFDVIERGVQSGQPKYMEWYAAFGLMVTLVWLYLEVLRLLARRR
ncbi:MAG: Bax inhibitor-1/YccA family protein [Thermacetogeniaceae bacterium]